MITIKSRTPEQVVNLWIKALRSGKYKRQRTALRCDGGFCCLGVLCDLAVKDGGASWQLVNGSSSMYSFLGESYSLPKVIKKFLKLSDNEIGGLVDLNDVQCLSFTQIALYIETNIKPIICKI